MLGSIILAWAMLYWVELSYTSCPGLSFYCVVLCCVTLGLFVLSLIELCVVNYADSIVLGYYNIVLGLTGLYWVLLCCWIGLYWVS